MLKLGLNISMALITGTAGDQLIASFEIIPCVLVYVKVITFLTGSDQAYTTKDQ